MVLVETNLFTRLLPEYLEDDAYCLLRIHLIEHPDAGARY